MGQVALRGTGVLATAVDEVVGVEEVVGAVVVDAVRSSTETGRAGAATFGREGLVDATGDTIGGAGGTTTGSTAAETVFGTMAGTDDSTLSRFCMGGPKGSTTFAVDQRCNSSRASLVLSAVKRSLAGRGGGASMVLSNAPQAVQNTRWLSGDTSAATSA